MDETRTYTVKYQIATYSGTVDVVAGPDDDNDVIIARAKRLLVLRAGALPFGSESFRVVSNG